MANIDKYIKQEWVNNDTKLSAENLNKVEAGLATLSEQTGQYVTEWADEWSTFKETEFAGISSNVYDNSCNIETAFNTLSGHYDRLENLDAAVAGINTPVQTVSASVDAKATTWAETNQTEHFDSVPLENHHVRLDISLSGSAATDHTSQANKMRNKKRLPLYSFSNMYNAEPLGVGPDTCYLFNGTELWSKLLTEQPGASWENIASDEEESLLGNPITALNDKLTFAVYYSKLNTTQTTKIISTYNYDSNIDCILIFYSAINNKYYFANLNNLSLGYDLRFWFGSATADASADTSGTSTRFLGIEQCHTDCEILPLPAGDSKLMYMAFMTKTDHIEELGLQPFDYFVYLGDLYTADLLHPYVFRMQGDEGNYYDGFSILYTGTYYLSMTGVPQNVKDFWYKIGSSQQGPYSNTEGPMASPNWSQYFSNALITYKFTCPTGTSNAYKVLELCQKHTDDDIKQIAKRTLNDLISFGSDDPTSSTSGKFYFKTNNAD